MCTTLPFIAYTLWSKRSYIMNRGLTSVPIGMAILLLDPIKFYQTEFELFSNAIFSRISPTEICI